MTHARHQRASVAVLFVVTSFMSLLDTTIVNVAIPSIASDFGVPVTSVAAVNVNYLVAFAISITTAAWLGDRFGSRRVLLIALLAFSAASAACGLTQTLQQLTVLRIAQGAGAGVLVPLGMAMMYRTFAPARRVRLARFTMVPIAVAPALGPVLGGFISESASWRWIFWVNVPVGIATAVFAMLFVRPFARAERKKCDIPGLLLAAGGLGTLMYAISEGTTFGWTSPRIVVSTVVGICLLGGFVIWELGRESPLLNVRLFANSLFRVANVVSLLSVAAFFGALFLYPLMLQVAFGLAPLAAGLLTFPEALGVILGAQLGSRIYQAVGPRRLVTTGQVLVAVVLLTLALTSTANTPLAQLVILMTLLGFGHSCTFMPIQACAFDTIASQEIGGATALYQATRQIGMAAGVAVAATVLALASYGLPNDAVGPYQVAFEVAAAISTISAAVAWLLINDDDAAVSRGLA